MRASAEITSALPTTRVPASVAGPVKAADAIVMKPTGIPASAASKAASRLPPSWPSGLVVHCIIERTGRTRSASRPPAIAAAISIAARASRRGDDRLGLDVLRAVGPAGQQLVERPRGGRAVLGRDRDPVERRPRRGRRRGGRSRRRRRSPTGAARRSRGRRPRCRSRRWRRRRAGRRAAGRGPGRGPPAGRRAGPSSGRPRSSPGARGRPRSRGRPSAPAAAHVSSARSDGKRTPTVSMTWRVASWIRAIASASSASTRMPPTTAGLTAALTGRPLRHSRRRRRAASPARPRPWRPRSSRRRRSRSAHAPVTGAPPTITFTGGRRPRLGEGGDDGPLAGHRRGQERGQPDDVGAVLPGGLDEALGGHVHAEVVDLEAGGREQHPHEVLADLVDVAGDGADDDAAGDGPLHGRPPSARAPARRGLAAWRGPPASCRGGRGRRRRSPRRPPSCRA